MVKKHNLISIIIGSIAVVFSIGVGMHFNVIKLPVTNVVTSQWGQELDSYEGTMSAVSNVFVGKVVKQVGTRARFEEPETQFEVEVLYNIKGDLQGKAIVSQSGGYKNGVLYRTSDDITVATDKPVKEQDNGLMKEGETYLFVTRYSEMGNWYSIYTHSKGTKLLSRDGNLNAGALKKLYEKDERFISLKEAYEKVKTMNADVKSENVANEDR
ncbi:MAG: hypothetical protein WCQ96_04100 [Patescibacteria group bacterium]